MMPACVCDLCPGATYTPSRLFHWLLAMVIAAAEVKPAMTGKEKKSMRNPRRRKPAMRITIPVKKVSRIAYSGPKWEILAVIKAMIAVGPMLMSFSLPKMM